MLMKVSDVYGAMHYESFETGSNRQPMSLQEICIISKINSIIQIDSLCRHDELLLIQLNNKDHRLRQDFQLLRGMLNMDYTLEDTFKEFIRLFSDTLFVNKWSHGCLKEYQLDYFEHYRISDGISLRDLHHRRTFRLQTEHIISFEILYNKCIIMMPEPFSFYNW